MRVAHTRLLQQLLHSEAMDLVELNHFSNF
jgi:hypothetical protein